MAEQTHWIEIRLRVREVAPADLLPGDKVWYFIRKHAEMKKLNKPDAYGPFTVVTPDPFVLRNSSLVELKLPPEKLILLVPTSSPPEII